MKKNKKVVLLEQVKKIDGVLQSPKANFNCEDEISEEYSFLTIVRNLFKEGVHK